MHQIDSDRKLNRLGRWLHVLGLLVVLAIAAGAEFLLYRPIAAKASVCARRADKLQALLHNQGQVRAEHTRLGKDLAEARKQAAALEDRIPNEPREAEFLAQLSRLASEVELQIEDYRPNTIVRKPDYSVLQVDLICEGGYASICNFLDRISRLPRHSTVVSLQIDSAGGGRKYPAKISLQLYFAGHGPSDADKKGTSDA